jgi:hypothetical protein
MICFFDSKLPLTNGQSSLIQRKIELHQKETRTNEWEENHTCVHDSAQVRSTMKGQVHECIGMSTSENHDELLEKFNKVLRKNTL